MVTSDNVNTTNKNRDMMNNLHLRLAIVPMKFNCPSIKSHGMCVSQYVI